MSFTTLTHQRWVQQPISYTLMEMMGLPAGAFTPDSRVTPEAKRLMESGEAEEFLEHNWNFSNPEPDFPQ